MDDEKKSARKKVSDGIKQGIGVLSAFKDALEETINEARERGDLSTDRAKEVMRSALDKAQDAAEGARERLDFVTQKDFEDAIDGIKSRISAIEKRFTGGGEEEGDTGGGDGGPAETDGGAGAEEAPQG